MTIFSTAAAFLRRELLEEASYPLKILFSLVATLIGLGLLVVFTDFVGRALTVSVGAQDSGYFGFALVGLGFHMFLDTALRELSSRIRQAQYQGTLEALLATRTPLSSLLIALPLYPLLRTWARFAMLLTLGWLLLDLEVELGNLPVAGAVFVLSITVFAALGLAFAGVTVVFKRTEPVIAMFNASSFFLCGVLVPTGELPQVLQSVSVVLPLSPALDAFRTAVLSGGDWAAVASPMGQLLAFAVILVPMSLVIFRWSLRRAMQDGSLAHY